MAGVILENLSKYFGRVVAVENLNLEIKDGEFIALLGPSGCGKTTTLLMVAGIYRPTKGRILFNGVVVNDVHPRERNIGMVFQSYALYPHMTVFENIAFPLELQKIPKAEIRRRVEEVVELVRIGDLLERRPGEISGGQQQRVALSRALVKKPEILLFDEPLSNLDAKLRISMRSELKRLQKELKITTILVTHDQIEAMTMADRIVLLKDGRLQQVGDHSDLYYKPKNVFVAGFIGSTPMNFLTLSLTKEGEKIFAKEKDIEIEIPERFHEKVKGKVGSEVIMGVRPEDIKIHFQAQEKLLGSEIYVVEPLGREYLVSLILGDNIIKAIVPPPFNLGIGEKVWLDLTSSDVHFFDPQSEEAL